MSTLLSYALTASQFPLQAAGSEPSPVSLTLLATNPAPNIPVVLQGIIITISVGPDASDLTLNTLGIGPVAPAGWPGAKTAAGSGIINFIFEAPTGGTTVAGEALQFVLNNFQTNIAPGSSFVVITEGSNNCNPSVQGACPTQTIPLTKFPNGWGQVSFWVDPPDIDPGGSTTLNWSGPSGTYQIVYAEGGNIITIPSSGRAPLGNEGQYPGVEQPPLTLQATTTFSLSVSDKIDNVEYTAQIQKQVTVAVPAPTINSFSATLQSIDLSTSQMTVSLSWTSQNTDQFHIDDIGTFSGADAVQGSTQATIALSCKRPFVATAYGMVGYSGPPASQTLTFTVPSVFIPQFQAGQDAFAGAMGNSSMVVNWGIVNAVAFNIQPGDISGNNPTPTSFTGITSIAGSNPRGLILTAQGCQSVNAHPSILSPTQQPQWLSFGNPGMQGIKLDANFSEANFFSGAELFGWASISAVSIAKANQILAVQQIFPSDISVQQSSDGIDVSFSGTVSNWAIQPGGDGRILTMSTSLEGTLSVGGESKVFSGLVATFEIVMGNPPFQVDVVNLTSNPQYDRIYVAILEQILQQWLTQNAASFDPMLSQLSPLLTLQSGNQWIKPTSNVFSYADDPLQRGWFYTGCQFAGFPGDIPPPIQFEISPTAQDSIVFIDSTYAVEHDL